MIGLGSVNYFIWHKEDNPGMLIYLDHRILNGWHYMMWYVITPGLAFKKENLLWFDFCSSKKNISSSSSSSLSSSSSSPSLSSFSSSPFPSSSRKWRLCSLLQRIIKTVHFLCLVRMFCWCGLCLSTIVAQLLFHDIYYHGQQCWQILLRGSWWVCQHRNNDKDNSAFAADDDGDNGELGEKCWWCGCSWSSR